MIRRFVRPVEQTDRRHVNILMNYVKEMEEVLYGFDSGEVDFRGQVEWIESLIQEQDEQGFWGLDESAKRDADARIEFWYEPTYIALATMMYFKMTYRDATASIEGFENAFIKGLTVATTGGLVGHGYDSRKGTLRGLNIFAYGKILSFNECYPKLCVSFTKLIKKHIVELESYLEKGEAYDAWGNDDMPLIQETWDLLKEKYTLTRVFVYGTLMKGEYNHRAYLENANYLGKGKIEGFSLYNLGHYPGIVPCEEEWVQGEVYSIDAEILKELDRLEGEGTLYKRQPVDIVMKRQNLIVKGEVYVYMGTTVSYKKVDFTNQPWTSQKKEMPEAEDLVWYACYGSNLCYERFLSYIKGTYCIYTKKTYKKCENAREPRESMPIILPYQLYFGNISRSWEGKGVAFLDLATPGITLGRMYLITKEQFDHIVEQEGSNENWYNQEVTLGEKSGIPIKTFTNNRRRPKNKPSDLYVQVIAKGIAEVYPYLTITSIDNYLLNE